MGIFCARLAKPASAWGSTRSTKGVTQLNWESSNAETQTRRGRGDGRNSMRFDVRASQSQLERLSLGTHHIVIFLADAGQHGSGRRQRELAGIAANGRRRMVEIDRPGSQRGCL